ncbi:ATP-dependent RNA helicase DEAH12, chloroplastic-like [Mangifera indica]|uniref:ATP-dependent RNA helicase DEAH12, chloroplastic-like n=1 Tax=Mangifera indica TaxID=29780 RepID=UPI001CFAEDB3|nr:ATP-dependent RNA helicase DEAH12, chloroplastic-like [Mangifera indica]
MKRSFHRNNSYKPLPNYNYHYRPKLPPNSIRPQPPPAAAPNFVIHLSGPSSPFSQLHLENIVSKLNLCHQKVVYSPTECSFFFGQWVDTLNAMISLWESRLHGVHNLTPRLVANVVVPSDKDELEERLKLLFADHIRSLMEGETVKKWQRKKDEKLDQIAAVSAKMSGRNRLSLKFFNELTEEKNVLQQERDLIVWRLREFKSSMRCLLKCIGCLSMEDECGEAALGFELFRLEDERFDWGKIQALIFRECKRLEAGLPIYVRRQEILKRIYDDQVMVLIGETGSGKSTQLVQFLADSGVGADRSIVCTQPRKIAAVSLAHRVREESGGCYGDDSVICYPTFSSAQQFDAKVIYMTDHCVLQHYMNDRNLSGISCIIVDEAHERSLNTDLLLALIKDLLGRRFDLRLVIMSATADANQLSDYFFNCKIFHVMGRKFPVDVRYVPYTTEGTSGSGIIASYVSDVVRMAAEVHRTEKEGTILAFLTSKMEVEWACEKFNSASAVGLPLHGKLTFEEQLRVFQNYPGKRKVIFATNVAETSLTIPGVKYVIDSGMVKESRFEPGTGMNVLEVCWISQSSANQRAGRAGRTEPGRCYRLYSKWTFESMSPNQEPEIRRVHLGVAVLRILALGMKNVQSFDFVDSPSAKAIEMAIRNLVQLGAIKLNNNAYELTKDGQSMVKLGLEPRLGKLVISCFNNRLGREGVVLAAVMANASSIFCRVGTDDDKLKADCLKVQFCHQNGDLFTLLSVYKEWESLPKEERNKWCWENSINAKSMWRCQETIKELEICLKKELNCIIPSYWLWDPQKCTEHDKLLKEIILSALSENVAMYSGYDQLGYEVALTGQHVQIHPSSSLLIFGQKPNWVVFSELLSASNQYLVCVTAFDIESLSTLCSATLFDVSKMEKQKLQVRKITAFGSILLKKFCGKSNSNVHSFLSRLWADYMDKRIGIEVNIDRNQILVFASSQDIDKVVGHVNNVLEYEKRWLLNECIEKCLYHGAGVSPSLALFGAGAEIKHLELEKRFLTIDVFHSNANILGDKELLMFLEKKSSGSICAVHKFTGAGQDSDDNEKWGSVTFLTPDAARKAAELNEVEFGGSLLKVLPSRAAFGFDKTHSFPAVRARVSWPRRHSKGVAIAKCNFREAELLINDLSNLTIGGRFIRCEVSRKCMDSVVISGLDKELSEDEVLDELRKVTERRFLDFFLVRGASVECPPCDVLEEALLREISHFMPKRNPQSNRVRVQVFEPESKDAFIRSLITFDGRLHLEAARALEQLEGKTLPGCLTWQKIKCQQLFHTSLSCPVSVYSVIKEQLYSLISAPQKGTECRLDRNDNGSYRVRISANATKTVADMRRPIEELMRGKTINNADLSASILQHLFSREGINLKKSLQQETKTCIIFDRHNHNIRIFGSSENVAIAEEKLIQSLFAFHESKQLEIHLRGGALPPDLMKRVVKKFGPDLHGLKERVPKAEFTLNSRRQVICMKGDKELKQKVEEIVYEIALKSDGTAERDGSEYACPICLCEVEESYRLEGCGHTFCQSCLVEQCDSAMKNLDSFPICCAHGGCKTPILLADLRCLLTSEKLEELFRASLSSYVASSGGTYRFCPSPDCPSIYRVADPETEGEPFFCGACFTETCTKCHLEHHPFLSCEKYKEFKEDPDVSLKEWCQGKENVKTCPVCGYTIEKVDGCNHVECKCGKHVCWVCLDYYNTAEDCYGHMRAIHMSII